MDSMAAVKIENVIMAEVLRWWKQRKELILTPLQSWSLDPLNPHRLQQCNTLFIYTIIIAIVRISCIISYIVTDLFICT